MNAPRSQRGFLLILAVIIIMVAAVMAAAIATLTSGGGQSGGQHVGSTQALFAAESGIERALYGFTRQGAACTALGYTGTLTIGSVAANYSTSAGPLYNPANPTTLSAAITAGATTIATNAADLATAGYAPRGRIRIDTEEIIYTGLSGGSFTGAQRGAAGTVAAGHLINASVYQNQCTIQSVGTAPGSTQRTLEKAVVGRSFKYGSFQKNTGVAPQPQTITGVGFRPKAVIFYWTTQTADGFINDVTGAAVGINMGVGFATGTANERAVSVTAVDNSGSSDDGRRRSDTNMIILLNAGGPPTVAAQAELTSLNADGFTINWTTNDANAYRIHYLALGGDITNALAGSFNLTTAGANQSVAGLGFQPDFVMFLWSFTEAVNTNTATANIGVGLARSATARGAIAYAARDGIGNNNTKRWQQRTDSTIFLLSTGNPPARDAVADFVSMDAGGFTITKSDAPANSTPIFYLALKGGQHQVGAFTQPAATGNQTTATVGFEPQGLALLSWNRVASTSSLTPVGGVGPEVSAAVSFGAASATTERGSIWFQDRNVDNSDANMYTATTDAITLATGPSTANARADFYSFNTGGFTLNWATADATARQILYWAVGPSISNTNMGWREVYP